MDEAAQLVGALLEVVGLEPLVALGEPLDDGAVDVGGDLVAPLGGR